MIPGSRLSTVSWQCIHFGIVRNIDVLTSELSKLGIRCSVVAGQTIHDDRDLFAELDRAFQFPDYFGWNWDALDECLRDLEWLPAKGYVMLVTSAAVLWVNSPLSVGRLVETWLLSAEEWSKSAIPFHLVFEMSDLSAV